MLMTVFHGSYVEIPEPMIIKGKYTKDFGTGFYCTLIREQAERWAKRYEHPIVNMYEARLNSQLRIKEFVEMDDEWLDFIAKCRKGEKHRYDVVIGAMANDQIYNYVSDYLDGIISKEQFWVLAKFKYPTHQINFCTTRALECLEFVSSKEVF